MADSIAKKVMEAVKDYRIIYDKSEKDFRDSKKKENAMVEIATKLGITTEDVSRHYKSQRSNFGKYLNSLEVPSGSSRDKVKLDPEQEHLRWLICHIAPRTTKTSMQKKKQEDNNTTSTTSTTTYTVPDLADSDQEIEETAAMSRDITVISDDENGEGAEGRSTTPSSVKSVASTSKSNSSVKIGKRKAEIREKPWSKTNKYDREQPSKFEMMLLNTLSDKENSAPRDPAQIFSETVAERLRKLSEYQFAIVHPKILSLITETQYSTPANPQCFQQNAAPTTSNYPNNYQSYPPQQPPSYMSNQLQTSNTNFRNPGITHQDMLQPIPTTQYSNVQPSATNQANTNPQSNQAMPQYTQL